MHNRTVFWGDFLTITKAMGTVQRGTITWIMDERKFKSSY